jgi:antitoxin VapB
MYRNVYTETRMATGKIFMSGNSQAVRLPKEFRLDADEVEITREGDKLILDPKRKSMKDFLELLYSLPEDMFVGIKDERPPEEREEF